MGENRGTKQVAFLNDFLCDSKKKKKKKGEGRMPSFLAFIFLQESEICFSSSVVCFGGLHFTLVSLSFSGLKKI